MRVTICEIPHCYIHIKPVFGMCERHLSIIENIFSLHMQYGKFMLMVTAYKTAVNNMNIINE